MSAPLPRTFSEVPGWREAFREAAQRLDEVRTGSLFPALPVSLCGVTVRPFSMHEWTVLDQADNPLVAGGTVGVEHCIGVVWLLSPEYRPASAWARFLRRRLVWRCMRWAKHDEDAIIRAVMRFVDDAFLDWPGRFAAPSKGGGGIKPTEWPRKCMEVEYCAEVMRAYPSFTYSQLRRMPLAQFWQWLHEARAQRIPDYRNYQLTDHINAKASALLNDLRREAAAT